MADVSVTHWKEGVNSFNQGNYKKGDYPTPSKAFGQRSFPKHTLSFCVGRVPSTISKLWHFLVESSTSFCLPCCSGVNFLQLIAVDFVLCSYQRVPGCTTHKGRPFQPWRGCESPLILNILMIFYQHFIGLTSVGILLFDRLQKLATTRVQLVTLTRCFG